MTDTLQDTLLILLIAGIIPAIVTLARPIRPNSRTAFMPSWNLHFASHILLLGYGRINHPSLTVTIPASKSIKGGEGYIAKPKVSCVSALASNLRAMAIKEDYLASMRHMS
jgi:hypothetical protein